MVTFSPTLRMVTEPVPVVEEGMDAVTAGTNDILIDVEPEPSSSRLTIPIRNTSLIVDDDQSAFDDVSLEDDEFCHFDPFPEVDLVHPANASNYSTSELDDDIFAVAMRFGSQTNLLLIFVCVGLSMLAISIISLGIAMYCMQSSISDLFSSVDSEILALLDQIKALRGPADLDPEAGLN